MLDGFGLGSFVSLASYLKRQLLEEMDEAYEANDLPRCLNAIERLYGVYDDERTVY